MQPRPLERGASGGAPGGAGGASGDGGGGGSGSPLVAHSGGRATEGSSPAEAARSPSWEGSSVAAAAAGLAAAAAGARGPDTEEEEAGLYGLVCSSGSDNGGSTSGTDSSARSDCD